jgi:hypothetical protein
LEGLPHGWAQVIYPLDERPLADGISQTEAYQRLAKRRASS